MARRYRPHAATARSEQLRLRLTAAELDILREAAARAGLTPSGYAAEAAVAAAHGVEAPTLAPWREALRELMLLRGQLRRIGSNLNQASRAINVDGQAPIWLERLCGLVERNVAQVDAATEALRRLAKREVPATHQRLGP